MKAPGSVYATGYQAPVCECGHAAGEHRFAYGPLNVQPGVCLSCPCRMFTEVKERQTVTITYVSDDRCTVVQVFKDPNGDIVQVLSRETPEAPFSVPVRVTKENS